MDSPGVDHAESEKRLGLVRCHLLETKQILESMMKMGVVETMRKGVSDSHAWISVRLDLLEDSGLRLEILQEEARDLRDELMNGGNGQQLDAETRILKRERLVKVEQLMNIHDQLCHADAETTLATLLKAIQKLAQRNKELIAFKLRNDVARLRAAIRQLDEHREIWKDTVRILLSGYMNRQLHCT
ncbi:hypothetical protein MPER_13251 [Moniliophthora perniciosa FA553]|nr:hypothetical protein MPER_13251 [Moniliophthora perniciosa FA553]